MSDDLCPSCREPINSPSGDGCAAMTMHQPVNETPKIDWKAALEAEHDSLPKRLERVALLAETADYWTDDHRLMPAAGVADILYEALDEIKRARAEALRDAIAIVRLGGNCGGISSGAAQWVVNTIDDLIPDET